MESASGPRLEQVRGYLDQGQIPRVWACSPFVSRLCIADPDLLGSLLQGGRLQRRYSADEFGSRLGQALDGVDDEVALRRHLRRFRNREMLRIAWRDIVGAADLNETIADLSRLADAVLRHCTGYLQCRLEARFGRPIGGDGETQGLMVLAMGKLGGAELNFSSDIDLVFVFPHGGETDGQRVLSNQEFFTHLGKGLIKILSEVTADGFVFRVDMRLRPFGDSGPLVVSHGALEEYYQVHARDWERYAMVKGRLVVGDAAAGERLLATLQPFVYRRYVDFGAVQSIRKMKGMIDAEIARKGLVDDIKLGPGGIREIEFIGQTFQLIHGGREPRLRLRSIMPTLATLARLGLLPQAAAGELADAYQFLRTTEHRLQQVQDRQTQTLPQDTVERQRLAFGMGYADWEGFFATLSGHRQRVVAHFSQLFRVADPGADPDSAADIMWLVEADRDGCEAYLVQLGYDDPQGAALVIQRLLASHAVRRLNRDARARLDRLLPMLLNAAADSDHASVTVGRLLKIVEAVVRRSAYLALLAENPQALAQLVRLCAASPWVGAQIAQQPVLLDELLDPRHLYTPPSIEQLPGLLGEALGRLPPGDLEGCMECLRSFKQVQVLRVAAADIAAALPVARVSDHLSGIAEAVLNEALALAWAYMIERHGRPRAGNLAVVAYGKLGGLELGYSSDLDVVFVYQSAPQDRTTDGPRPLEEGVFFSRLVQRVIHVISTITSAGRCYEVDMRLRPGGASGLLVSRLGAFEDYQRRRARTWEHQALVRARAVAGDPETQQGFEDIRRAILAQPRDPVELRSRIAEMRERMYRELCTKKAETYDLKHGRGGITEIEFVVQYCVLRWAAAHPELLDVTDNLRLLERLSAAGLLSTNASTVLHDAYFAYRADLHRLALQERPALVPDTAHCGHRQAVTTVWHQTIGTANGDAT